MASISIMNIENRKPSKREMKRCSRTCLDDLFKSPSLDFPGRKRKRHRTDDDNISMVSVDSVEFAMKPEMKRKKRSMPKIASIANLLSPVRPVKKVGHALQRSLSLKNLASTPVSNNSKHAVTPYRPPPPTPPKRRLSILWCDTVRGNGVPEGMDNCQLRRQESIFELYKSEEDLIEDLHMVKTTYHDSLKKLGLLSDKELDQIFGHIDSLMPLHEDLVLALRDQRMPDGTTQNVGEVLLAWVPRLESYVSYCSNQVFAKDLLDMKKHDPAVEDFLQRCQNSPFSRRLDLWSFLDVPRSRLVKYPLLLRSIAKSTPAGNEDVSLLEEASQVVEDIICAVDVCTGRAKCKLMRDKFDYLDDKQKHPLIEESQAVLCEGILKNNRGTKLHGFIFEKIMVLTRPATRGNQLRYQVYRQPMPLAEMVLLNLEDGQKMGSFKSTFTQTAGKNMFKVSFSDPSRGQSHTLQANDEHDKRQWLQCLRNVLPPTVSTPPLSPELRTMGDGQEDKMSVQSLPLDSN
ncbi:Neuroepithelial cell-transforming gene 1 protein [Lamellibrachia satsuma]|nr:Neuroepithelial cell-transforming gene 1 protein [Lamellibrachia satsuma]